MTNVPDASAPLIDGFADLREIGRGGFSVVYAGTQLGLNRPVAIKVINASGSEARRFEREALALGSLSGIANIVTTYQVGHTDDGRPAIVMELLPTSLGRELSRRGPVPLHLATRWASELGTALDRAHALGIHHRDIKPENVLLTDDDHGYLADFGIASMEALASATTTSMSLSPAFAPLERFNGVAHDPQLGDIYSLGATLYAALSGHPPFGTMADGGSLGLINRIANDEPAAITGVPLSVSRVLSRAMAKDPVQRYPTGRALADDLATAAVAPPPPTATLPRRPTNDATTVVRPPPPPPHPHPPPPPPHTTGPQAFAPPPPAASAPQYAPPRVPQPARRSSADRFGRWSLGIAVTIIVVLFLIGLAKGVSSLADSGDSGRVTRSTTTVDPAGYTYSLTISWAQEPLTPDDPTFVMIEVTATGWPPGTRGEISCEYHTGDGEWLSLGGGDGTLDVDENGEATASACLGIKDGDTYRYVVDGHPSNEIQG